MIVYADSSVLARALLPDEPGHGEARELIDDQTRTVITGSWSAIEVTGALVRAARVHRGDEAQLIAAFRSDVHPATGNVLVIDAVQAEVEGIAMSIVRRTGIRSLDAWHLACAQLSFEDLAEPGEERGFATRDTAQADIARSMGFTIV